MNRPSHCLAYLFLCLLLSHTAAAEDGTVRVEFGVIPGALKFEVSQFDVRAGGRTELIFSNNGLMPHNLVIGTRGSADKIVELAMALGSDGYAKGFVPESELILAATPLLNVKESHTLRFESPREAGEYPYVCTFPGHGTIMRGVMRVRAEGEELQEAVREQVSGVALADRLAESNVTPFPKGTLDRPLVMRTFVPNLGFDETVLANHRIGNPAPRYDPGRGADVLGSVGTMDGIPAAVSVNFGDTLSYVWDTTECRLLYAWTGGYFDMTSYWGSGAGGSRRSFGYLPRILGQVRFKTSGPMPLRIGDSTDGPVPRYRGYRLLAGSPEFLYSLGDVQVTESILPGDPGTISLHYTITGAKQAIQFRFDQEMRQRITAHGGTWAGNTLTLDKHDPAHIMFSIRLDEEVKE